MIINMYNKKRIILNELAGVKMTDKEIKLIVGGSLNDCCGYSCKSVFDGIYWEGCTTSPIQSDFCCYGK